MGESLDLFGCPIDTLSIDCVDNCNAFMKTVMKYGVNWTAGVKAFEIDSNCAFAAVCAVDGLIACQNIEKAKSVLDGIKSLSLATSSRVVFHRDALSAWLNGDFKEAAEHYLNCVKQYPTDMFSFKRAQLMYFFGNRNDDALAVFESDVLNIPSSSLPSSFGSIRAYLETQPWYGGMYSFVLEQAGRPQEALRAAEDALARLPADSASDDPWAQHGVFHALTALGEDWQCVERSAEWSAGWVRSEFCAFIYNHLWFHYSLALLNVGCVAAARDVIEKRLWNQPSDRGEFEVQQGAAGMALRVALRASHLPRSLRGIQTAEEGASVVLADVMDAHGSSVGVYPLLQVILAGWCVVSGQMGTEGVPKWFTCVDESEKAVEERSTLDVCLSALKEAAGCISGDGDASVFAPLLAEVVRRSSQGRLRDLIGSVEQVQVVIELFIEVAKRVADKKGLDVSGDVKALMLLIYSDDLGAPRAPLWVGSLTSYAGPTLKGNDQSCGVLQADIERANQ